MLPIISKIVERIIQDQLANHMEKEKLYHPNQHAYRKKLSTTTALIDLSDQIYQTAENREIAVAVAINQSSAFDCICHTILNDKLELY